MRINAMMPTNASDDNTSDFFTHMSLHAANVTATVMD
jgi:hypothetical protein